MKMKIILLAAFAVMMPRVANAMGPDIMRKHEIRHAQQKLSELLADLREVQDELRSDKYRFHTYNNIGDAIRYYTERVKNLGMYDLPSFGRLWVRKAFDEDRNLQFGTNEEVLAEQDFVMEKEKAQNNLSRYKEVERLQQDEAAILDDLADIAELIEFEMPEPVRKLTWDIPQDEMEIPARQVILSEAPAPIAPHFMQQHKKEIGAVVLAIAAAIATYIGRRTYINKKNRLVKKYELGTLTPLQNAIWRATALASMRMPWYLQYLVRKNPKSLTELVGSDPHALAELYYGHKPTQQEVQTFLAKFFGGVQ